MQRYCFSDSSQTFADYFFISSNNSAILREKDWRFSNKNSQSLSNKIATALQRKKCYLCGIVSPQKHFVMRRNYPLLLSTFAAILLLSLLPTEKALAQKNREISLEGNFMYYDMGSNFSYGVSAAYSWWMNPYFAWSVGGRILNSQLDVAFDSPTNQQVWYDIDDNTVMSLNASIGAKVASPTLIGKVGVFGSADFLFAPIPYNLISIDRVSNNPRDEWDNRKTISKLVYTKFSPNYSLKVGLYYKPNERTQGAIGFELGNFNPYISYREAKIDGLRVKDHVDLRKRGFTYGVFVRLSGLVQ
jgi:hypothetical protein